MASVKVKFRPSALVGGKGTVYYQVIHDRKSRQILTDYHLFSTEWDKVHSAVVIIRDDVREAVAASIAERIRMDLDRMARIIGKLNKKGLAFTADDIVDAYRRYSGEFTLFGFMEGVICSLVSNSKIRTSETYRAALNSFKAFRCNEDIMIDSIDSGVMEAYEAWQKTRGNSQNTVSFYNRILRAVYNRALENDIIENRYPFRHVYTGVDKTVKRALPLAVVRKIKALDLSMRPALDYARDMFMLSFMLRGMSFVDMAYLRKSDLSGGYVKYRRRKTGQLLVIEWTNEMQMILDKYPENTGVYLLPVITKPGHDVRRVYKNAGDRINHNLKKIAGLVGLGAPLSLYVARHSWASIARSEGVPVSIISEGMGHESESTTRIYLESLSTDRIDSVNSMLINLL
ncbi:MAG: site-specific integrase [Muribaculaceae bacterium]|nr:site-specific integrase [Muribaculaceae bacterium]